MTDQSNKDEMRMQPEEFERRYTELFFVRERYQWENYSLGSGHDLNIVDHEIYRLVKSFRGQSLRSGRRGKVLNAIVMRELVDKHPDISHLRNQLDDRENYRTGTAESENRDVTNDRCELASLMKPDVLELMRKRNALSQDLGFHSYVDLILDSEELNLKSLLSFLNTYVNRNLPKVRNLIKTYQLSLHSWLSDLAIIGNIDSYSDPNEILSAILEKLGLIELRGNIQLHVKQQNIAGYVGVISVPEDIRILIRSYNSLNSQLTIFHELGHAVAHASNKETGIFKTWTVIHDECMAVVMEYISSKLFLSPENLESANDLRALETMRCAISALFEFSLWIHPDNAEQLYVDHYERLGLAVDSPEMWALDSFRSIDPVYIHNFVIADRVAERTLSYLERIYGNDEHEWGPWLKIHYYADGRKRSLIEKINAIGFVNEWY
jgi:hypothetical protein